MEIGKLDFYIPGDDGADALGRTLSFEQNISVSESKKANYAKYDILARPSTIYAYLGAKSRVIKLSFDILLDHLTAFPDTGSSYIDLLGNENDFTPGIRDPKFDPVPDPSEENKALQKWIDTIRKCVSNDSKDPTTGPPTIIFNYTEAYKDISCICLDYKINIKAQDKAGFSGSRDEAGLPRFVNFSLSLEEIV